MQAEIEHLREIQSKAMPTTVMAQQHYLVPLSAYTTENLFHCHYCPQGFQPEAERKRHNEKEYADYEKNQMGMATDEDGGESSPSKTRLPLLICTIIIFLHAISLHI